LTCEHAHDSETVGPVEWNGTGIVDLRPPPCELFKSSEKIGKNVARPTRALSLSLSLSLSSLLVESRESRESRERREEKSRVELVPVERDTSKKLK